MRKNNIIASILLFLAEYCLEGKRLGHGGLRPSGWRHHV